MKRFTIILIKVKSIFLFFAMIYNNKIRQDYKRKNMKLPIIFSTNGLEMDIQGGVKPMS